MLESIFAIALLVVVFFVVKKKLFNKGDDTPGATGVSYRPSDEKGDVSKDIPKTE